MMQTTANTTAAITMSATVAAATKMAETEQIVHTACHTEMSCSSHVMLLSCNNQVPQQVKKQKNVYTCLQIGRCRHWSSDCSVC